jgi:hypothetical protein
MTWLGFELTQSHGKPATNRLIYGTACEEYWLSLAVVASDFLWSCTWIQHSLHVTPYVFVAWCHPELHTSFGGDTRLTFLTNVPHALVLELYSLYSQLTCLAYLYDKQLFLSDRRFSRQWLGRMPSSGMWRHVALVRTDVSEECITFIIRVTRMSELRTTLAVTSNWSKVRQRNVGSYKSHGVTSQKTVFFNDYLFKQR